MSKVFLLRMANQQELANYKNHRRNDSIKKKKLRFRNVSGLDFIIARNMNSNLLILITYLLLAGFTASVLPTCNLGPIHICTYGSGKSWLHFFLDS